MISPYHHPFKGKSENMHFIELANLKVKFGKTIRKTTANIIGLALMIHMNFSINLLK